MKNSLSFRADQKINFNNCQGWEKTRVFLKFDPPAGFWVGKWVGKWVFLGSSKVIKISKNVAKTH
jgi:hypothetical protein